MEIIFITHHNILDLHTLPPLVSWLVVIGGVYGSWRLALTILGPILRPVGRTFRDVGQPAKPPPADEHEEPSDRR